MVTKEPDGTPHPGINRYQYPNIPDVDYIEEIIKPQTVWNPTKFLNLWTVKMPVSSILGYSYLPIPTIQGTDVDGVVIAHNKFGYFPDNGSLGRTATHEVGHYLGLKHPWGDVESCNSDDGISDTPTCSGPYYGCPSHPQISCGTTDMFMNFMDYVTDNCMHAFTKGQGQFMQGVLGNQRLALSNGHEFICGSTTASSNQSELLNDVLVYPNPMMDNLNIKFPKGFEGKEFVLKLMNIQGTVVAEKKLTSLQNSMDLSYINDGAYVLKITADDGIFTRKILKLSASR